MIISKSFFYEGNTARETPAETLLKNKMEVKEYLQSSYEAVRELKKRTEREQTVYYISSKKTNFSHKKRTNFLS